MILEEENHELITWDNPKSFIARKYTFKSLVNISNRVDATIFIFKADYKTWFINQ